MALAFATAAQAAPDAPLRERLKERLTQRQAASPVASSAGLATPGDHRITLMHDGLERQALVHVPARYDPARPAALLVALHGGGGHMELQADDRFYGQISESEQRGHVVVFPNGFSRMPGGRLATWNAGRCCGAARDAGVDDVGFIRRLVERLVADLAIDRGRVYATGMSNGGLMAYRLACELPDVFRAIAPVAGTDNTTLCQPGRPVSVLHIHARNDDHVLFDGGAGPSAVRGGAVTAFTSVPATIDKWARLNECTAPPQRVLDQGPGGATCDAYAACRDGARVQWCVTPTGGHSWPGGRKPRGGGEAPSQAISANTTMWRFFDGR